MSVQKDLNGEPLPEHIRGRDHLTMVKPANPSSLSADADRSEAWCIDCANRITVGSREWGHNKQCEHHREPVEDDEDAADVERPEDETTLRESCTDEYEVGSDE
jgi:hypothetical protein